MSYGIRITDKKNSVVSVDLNDILAEIHDGDKFYWSILNLYCTGHLSDGKSIPVSEDLIEESEKGIFITWNDLHILAKELVQIYDITLLGCFNENLINRYDTKEEMHTACDIVIEMIDCNFWEIFTKDKSLIERLAKKFKEVEWIMKSE